jgi:hypothetical protein
MLKRKPCGQDTRVLVCKAEGCKVAMVAATAAATVVAPWVWAVEAAAWAAVVAKAASADSTVVLE